jgi:hypothetical protein
MKSGQLSGPSPADFTEIEKTSLAEILAYALDPANQDRELMHCIDLDGVHVIDESVGYKSAEVTEKMRCAMESGRVRLWHNHPSGGSISDKDWELAGISEGPEILAVTVSGTIYVGRMTEWPDRFDSVMRENFRALATDLNSVLQQFTREQKVFDERLASDHLDGHLLNLCMAKCGVVRYAAVLSVSDSRAWADADRVGLVAHGVDWATQQITIALLKHAGSSSG